jgi:hypothetical protein
LYPSEGPWAEDVPTSIAVQTERSSDTERDYRTRTRCANADTNCTAASVCRERLKLEGPAGQRANRSGWLDLFHGGLFTSYSLPPCLARTAARLALRLRSYDDRCTQTAAGFAAPPKVGKSGAEILQALPQAPKDGLSLKTELLTGTRGSAVNYRHAGVSTAPFSRFHPIPGERAST